MMNKEQIYQEVASLLTSLFEIAPEDIHPEARLYEISNSTALMLSIWWFICKNVPAVKLNRKPSAQCAPCRMWWMPWNN